MKSAKLAAAIAAATVLVPASAQAAPAATRHQFAARAATIRLADAVRSGNRAGALRALKASRHQAASATRLSRRLVVQGATVRAARAAKAAALAYDANLAAYAATLPAASPAVAKPIAQALVPSMAGRGQAVAMLGGLMGQVPVAARPGLATAITSITEGAPQDAQSLAGAIPALPVDIQAIVAQAFAAASAYIDTALTQVEAILPLLPAIAQGPVKAVLGLVTSQIAGIQKLITQVLGMVLPAAGATGAPAAGGLGGLIPGLGGGFGLDKILGLVQGILGGVLG